MAAALTLIVILSALGLLGSMLTVGMLFGAIARMEALAAELREPAVMTDRGGE